MSLLLTERLIQRQINHWNRLREFLQEGESPRARPRGPVITVSRLAGSGGRRLAAALADRLDLDLHDQSLVERIARDRDLQSSVVSQLDERAVSQAQLWVQGVLRQRIFLRDEYHTALVAAVTTLAARGNAVFLGRGANLILGHHADLRLRVVADRATRLRRLRAARGLEADEADAALERTDTQRAEFIRKVFHQEPGRPENFDVVFNGARLDTDAMVDQVLLLLGSRTPARTATAGA